MALFTIDQVLMATGGQLLVSGQAQFNGVSTDTRTLQPGDLFVALKGETFNGHDYLQQAKDQGAAGALVQERVPGVRTRHTVTGDFSIVDVTDTLYALGQLARYHRRRFKIPVVGITGSAGKTTTKEMTACILEQAGPVLKTHANYNNEIGLPMTLFKLRYEHQAAVLEFGMRGRGQIGYLASIAAPTIGVITNVGLTHLELLGSQEEIALAKAELLDEMAPGSTAILPRDDDFFPLLREHAKSLVTTVGETDASDFWVGKTLLDEQGCARFTLHAPGGDFPVCLSAPGRHQIRNALAAAAAAITAGATPAHVQAGLAAYLPDKGRMRAVQAPGGYTVIDDSYNANPAAMRATLDYLAEVPGGKKIAILGDMRELGPTTKDLHQEIGRYAMEAGIDALIAVGELGKEYVAGAADPRALWLPGNEAAIEAARDMLHPGDKVLIKGSRAMGMEEIVAALVSG